MTEYGNYQTRVPQENTQRNTQKEVTKSNPIELKQVDPEASKVSLEVLSSPSATLETIAPLSKERFTSGDDEVSDKADLVRSAVMSSSNGANGDERVDSDIQQVNVHENEQSIDEPIAKDPAILKQIKTMNEDELDEALGKPEFENYIDEIIERLENLGDEVQASKAESEDVKAKELETSHQETENSRTIGLDIKNLENTFNIKISDIVVDSPIGKGFESLSDSTNLTKENVKIFKKETATLMVPSEEEAKKYKKNQKIEWNNETVKIKHIVVFTEEQKTAFNDFIETVNSDPENFRNFMGTYLIYSQQQTSAPEEKKDNKWDPSTVLPKNNNFHSELLSGDKTNNNGTQVNTDKKNKIEINLVTSPIILWQERNKKLEKELKLKDQKIEAEILKHEKMVKNINENKLKLELKTSDVELEHFKTENIKSEQDFKQTIHAYLNQIKHTENPEPLRVKFKESVITFRKFDRIIDQPNMYPANVVSDVISYKKDVLNMIQSMLKSTGGISNVKTGTASKSR